jgi:hypothetical protein
MPIANSSVGPIYGWPYLTTDPSVGAANSVFANESGWIQRHPGPSERKKDEILIAISQLVTTLNAAPLHYYTEVVNATISNIDPGNVAFRLVFNQPVVVTGTPGLLALGAGGLANSNLIYSAALSDPTAGKLVFANGVANVNVSVSGTSKYTVNATSVFGGTSVNAALANTSQTVSTVIATQANLTVITYKPTLTGILGGSAGSNAANSNVVFTVQYNEAVTVTSNSTAPSIVAISNHGAGVANQTIVYNSAASNTTNGTLVFNKASVDISSVNAGYIVFTINSTSTLVGFPLIVGTDDANVAQNTLNGIANTQAF